MEIKCPKSKEVVWTSKNGPNQVTSRLLSDFEERNFLGAGLYGSVVKAWSKIDKQYYAIKKIVLNDRNSGYDDVCREARAMAKLDHPNIVKYHTAWLETNIVGMVSNNIYDEYPDTPHKEDHAMFCIQEELCNGTLKDKMRHLTEEKIREIFQQLVNGLWYVHSKNIVHGDLSPANIFLDENATAKIGDFGHATLGEEEHVYPPASLYRAPELQLICTPELNFICKFTKSCDICSLGLILLEMLARGFIRDGVKFLELWKFKDEHVWPSSANTTNEDIKGLVRRMTSEDANERPTASYILENCDFHRSFED